MLESMIQEAQEDPGAEVDIPFLDDSVDDLQLPEEDDGQGQTEEILVGKKTIEIPRDLYTDAAVFNQFFSIDTWNDLLPEEVKMGLLQLLPSFPHDDIDEKAKTIEMLFGGENFHFGNPVAKVRIAFCPRLQSHSPYPTYLLTPTPPHLLPAH